MLFQKIFKIDKGYGHYKMYGLIAFVFRVLSFFFKNHLILSSKTKKFKDTKSSLLMEILNTLKLMKFKTNQSIRSKMSINFGLFLNILEASNIFE
jgi:hypothetical protein